MDFFLHTVMQPFKRFFNFSSEIMTCQHCILKRSFESFCWHYQNLFEYFNHSKNIFIVLLFLFPPKDSGGNTIFIHHGKELTVIFILSFTELCYFKAWCRHQPSIYIISPPWRISSHGILPVN